MVTLVQQQQQTLDDSHRHQKEQDRVNDVVSPNVETHVADGFRGVIARTAKEPTAVAVPGDGSVSGTSTQCSDIDDDCDEEDETDIEEETGTWVADLPIPAAIVQQHQAVAIANGDVVLPNVDPSNFGDVCVKNSTNVHLGNKTFYKGPVTIKQFVYTNPAATQDAINLDGINHISNTNVDLSTTNKGDVGADRPVFPKTIDLDKGNEDDLRIERYA